jgi:hypothetical protein
MAILAAICAILLIVTALWDVFETIILPRRVTRRLRLAAIVYRVTWKPWSWLARHRRAGNGRETFLSFYGPLALLVLLVFWAIVLVMGFALLQWAIGSQLTAADGSSGFGTDVYMSGTTFFTLGLGDVYPHNALSRVVTVFEAGTGFGLLAMVIAYLPILYQAFSRREVNISLLDARAGSPPSAVELLRRYSQGQNLDALEALLRSWETWAAELMESHLSYPSLAYFRSQHEHQSWVAALTTILDVCALAMVGIDGISLQSARLTFAMARHAAVDLGQVFNADPKLKVSERLSSDELIQLRALLAGAGIPLREGSTADQKLEKLRGMYEPFVKALSDNLLMPLPPWLPPPNAVDDWQTSVWQHMTTAQV